MNCVVERSVAYRNGVEYSIPSHVQFVKDMDAAKIPIELRRTHIGSMPCVRVKDKSSALKATQVGCDWDTALDHYIVFPYEHDPNLAEQQKYSWGR